METVAKEPIRLLEIERELAGPNRDAAFARYDAILVGLDRRLSAAQNADRMQMRLMDK